MRKYSDYKEEKETHPQSFYLNIGSTPSISFLQEAFWWILYTYKEVHLWLGPGAVMLTWCISHSAGCLQV